MRYGDDLDLVRDEAQPIPQVAQAERHVGKRIGVIGDALSVPGKTSKSYAARVIRRALGATKVDARLREFEEFGIEIKIVPLPREGRPWEAMSFPAFKYAELVEETWDVADLRERLQRLLIVPAYAEDRDVPQVDRVLGSPFFWTPSDDEWQTVQREWAMFQREIRNGRARSLTLPSATQCVHVRPHARDSRDTDLAPVVGPVVKKSFWLNQDYVGDVIRQHEST